MVAQLALSLPGSGQWAWDGSYLAGFRSALSNPLNFGPGGVVNRSIITTDLATVDNATLTGIDMFVGSWNTDTEGGLFSAAVMNFFLNGGDLLLLQDDNGHDPIGSSLGLSTTPSTGTDSNGGAPLYDGAFGTASNVHQLYFVGQLSAAEIAAHNGHVGGTNVNGEITSAYWAAGEYAVGAKRFVHQRRRRHDRHNRWPLRPIVRRALWHRRAGRRHGRQRDLCLEHVQFPAIERRLGTRAVRHPARSDGPVPDRSASAQSLSTEAAREKVGSRPDPIFWGLELSAFLPFA
ncbi:hypothetical protein LP419_14350 [Massilia sp. H-1]|nr:hypothetical protein LP419_14350 [Massilia sp. H-1]